MESYYSSIRLKKRSQLNVTNTNCRKYVCQISRSTKRYLKKKSNVKKKFREIKKKYLANNRQTVL